MSIVLGIFDGTHDSGACIIDNGVLIAACDTERFTRQKGGGGFPTQAIQACLETTNLTLNEIEHVAFAGIINPNPILRTSRYAQEQWRLDNGKFYAPTERLTNWIQFESPFPRLVPTKTRRWRLAKSSLQKLLRHQIRKRLHWTPQHIHLFEHHQSHAASAHYGSGFNNALILVADGIGDGLALSIWTGDGSELSCRFTLPYPHSLGLIYASFTGFLGYKPFRHEGKLTGLAARGNHQNIPIAFPFRGQAPNRQLTTTFPLYDWLEQFKHFAPEDIAAWLQHGVEQEILAILRWAVSTFGNRPIALAGGLFANVALNGRIATELKPSDLFVFPNMGDGGLAAGAAYLTGGEQYGWTPSSINSMMLGPMIRSNAKRLQQFVEGKPLKVTKRLTAESIEHAVDILASGSIIARAADRMEYGPRALGNRSILASAHHPAIHQTLNQRLNRTEFMPFAPIMRFETASKWIQAPACAWTAMRWMTITVSATPALREKCPAIVHVDNTLRPQLIRKEDNPTLWDLLEKFETKTGQPALINTSFNRHEEPIVMTDQDALNAFWESRLDALWLDDWWIEQK